MAGKKGGQARVKSPQDNAPQTRRCKPFVEFRLFGPLDVLIDGQPLPRLRSRKGRWLLGLLAMRGGREIERSWLAGTMWPDKPEPQAYGRLRTALIDLRCALGAASDCITNPTSRALLLDISPARIDVLEFDSFVERGDLESFKNAVSLYRGPLMEGCAEEWILPERDAREQAYIRAL